MNRFSQTTASRTADSTDRFQALSTNVGGNSNRAKKVGARPSNNLTKRLLSALMRSLASSHV